MDKDCLACHSFPPPLPAKVIKNLHTTYWKVNAQDTSEEKLSTKIKKPKVATKAKEGTRKSKEGANMSKEGTISAKSGQ